MPWPLSANIGAALVAPDPKTKDSTNLESVYGVFD
jgi:hypothetical protein